MVMMLATACHGAIRWYDQYDSSLELAKKTGRPLVLVFAPGTETPPRASKRVFEKDELAPFHRMFVFVFLEVNQDAKSGTFSHGMFQKYPPGAGAHAFPIIFFVDTDEKILLKVEGAETKDLGSKMAGVIKKFGGVADPKKTRDAQDSLDRATALVAKKRYGAAARLYKNVVDINLRLPVTETAKKELAKIEELAAKELAAARTDVADKAYASAIEKLSDLEKLFAPLPAAKEARDELAKLRQVPEAKEAFEKSERKDAPATVEAKAPDEATDLASELFTEEELDALDKMAGGAAAEETKATDGDAAAAECRRLLSLARSWIANKQPDKARELLDRIIEKHPDTLFADQAKALLKKIE
jgi:tetratricopeptide (TPR) repeat protein